VAVFGPEKGYPQRIGEVLRSLVHQGRLERLGAGAINNPYAYRIKPAAELDEPK
jgi:hypothetical protein